MKDQLGLILIGVGLATVVYGILYWVRVAKRYLRELIAALKAIPKLVQTLQRLAEIGAQVAVELQMLRSIMAANTAPQPQEAPGTEVTGEARPRGPHVPFPDPIMELYRNAPDAKVEDTVIEETDDTKMTEFEQLENLRNRGLEVEEEP